MEQLGSYSFSYNILDTRFYYSNTNNDLVFTKSQVLDLYKKLNFGFVQVKEYCTIYQRGWIFGIKTFLSSYAVRGQLSGHHNRNMPTLMFQVICEHCRYKIACTLHLKP